MSTPTLKPSVKHGSALPTDLQFNGKTYRNRFERLPRVFELSHILYTVEKWPLDKIYKFFSSTDELRQALIKESLVKVELLSQKTLR